MDRTTDAAALALFERYLEMPAATRDAWLAGAVADDDALAARVAAMIAADREGGIGTGGAARDTEPPPAPTRIGAYRIEGLIGHGGMGSVWRGVREDGDFAHEVAIKLIKPGLLSERLDARFRAERRLLAGLRHPNIAQLYDGGETADGAPYIVMELVEGEPLIAWADARGFAAEARAALFGAVCGAVAFAHRSLIVHRDITPSNILVTADGTPKLIDFGIARVAEAAADDADAPSLASLSLTPGFAAPERTISAAVTTAADIYSLGKVLAALIPARDADLDAVVARATAIDPAARYATVDALVDDMAAWCAHRPVAARDAGRLDRFAKLVRRNRVASIVTAVAALLLIAAFAATAIAYARAEAARQAEAARFADLRRLAGFVLFDVNGSLARVVGTLEARRAMADRAQRYLSGLARDAAGDAALADEAARGFVALALVRGVPTQPNLGQPAAARADLARALTLGSATTRAQALALRALIEGHVDGSPDKGARTLTTAEAALAGVPAPRRDAAWHLARSRATRTAFELATLGQKPDAILAAADQLAGDVARWPASLRTSRAAAIDRATAHHARAIHLYFIERPAAALAEFVAADRAYAALDLAVPNDPAVAYQYAYNAYLAAGVAASLPDRQRERFAFLATARNAIGRLAMLEPNDNMVAAMARSIRGAEAEGLSTQGRHAEAIALQRANVADLAARAADEPGRTSANKLILATVALANIARAGGDRATACAAYAEVGRQAGRLAREGALIDYIGNYRTAAVANAARCDRGGATATFTEM